MYSASSKLTKIGITLPSKQKQSYKEYLRSDHWASLRKEKLDKNPYCQQCGKPELLDVHHKQYRNLYDVRIADLKTLCRSCHEQLHKNKKSKIQKKQQRQNRKWNKKLSQAKLKCEPYDYKEQLKDINFMMKNPKNRRDPFFKQLKRDINFSTYVSIHY